MLRSVLAKPFAAWVVNQRKSWENRPEEIQMAWLRKLLDTAQNTDFGKSHYFKDIKTHADFVEAVPVADYEDFRIAINEILDGKPHVLWPDKPLYFAKTSGTTSGIKYIPISKESIPYHISGARDALLSYVHETGRSQFLDKKLIFLSGSPEMTQKNGIHIGRLSGIVNHHVPSYLRSNQMPSYETNCIDDWESKLERIIDETIDQEMGLISGIPPWVQMYFDRIQARTHKAIKDVFPSFSVFVYGGVNFEPYKAKLYESIGRQIDSIETYPASEGFIAYQDSQNTQGLLMLLNQGVFYEFIAAEDYFRPNPRRYHIGEVELGKNYAVIMSTNAGLWGYSIGDTVKFVSKNPYRIVVSGRIKHFISAFGEHVIGEEVEKAMQYASERHPEVEVIEFTVAPQVNPSEGGLPYHQWLIEFGSAPYNLEGFAHDLNERMSQLNVYYKDLMTGNILCPLKIASLKRNTFINYMRSQGKLGGQNKVPRLSNDRALADALLEIS
jgi:hypothetical protein